MTTALELPFDIFAPGAAATAVLVSMRVMGIMLVAPVFSAKTIPMMLKTALSILLTILLEPVAFSYVHAPPQITPVNALGETLIGFAIGLGAAILVGGAEAAGDLLATQIGLSGASLLDPLNNTSTPVLGNFFSLFTITLLLALNLHLGMLEALGTSFQTIPVGSSLNLQHGVGAMISLTGMLFTLGLRFAAPVVAVVMIGNAALAVLSRAAPQLNMLSVAFPLQIGLGLFALGIAVPFLATYVGDWPGLYNHQLTGLFNAFLTPGTR